MNRSRLLPRTPATPPTRRLAFIPEPVEPERSEEPAAPITPRCSWRTAPPPPPPPDAAGRAPMSERQQLALLLQMTSPAAASTPSSGEGSPATSCSTTPAQRRLHKRNERGETPLQVAAIRGDLRRVRRLIADGADVNATDFAGWTPLHEACIHGWSSVARELLAAGADANRPGLDRVTPLHDAAGNSRRRLVRLLLRHGADPSARTARGQRPADLASEPRVRALLETAAAGTDTGTGTAPDTDSSDDTEDEEEDKENQPSTPQRRPTRLTSRPCRLTAAMDASDSTATSTTTAATSTVTAATTTAAASAGDMYDFKPEQEGESPAGDHAAAADADKDDKKEAKQPASPSRADDSRPEDGKRPASEMEDADTEDSGKKKKKKDDAPKPAAKAGKGGEKAGKTAGKTVAGGKTGKGYGSGSERRSPTGLQGAVTPPKSKPASRTASDDSDGEERREGPKVPPLKIVINAASSAEQEQVKGGKGAAGARLPYVVASQAEAEPDEAGAETAAAQAAAAAATDVSTEAGSPGGASGSGGDKSSTPARVTRSQRALQGGSGDAASPESASGGGGGGSAADDRPAEEELVEQPVPPPPQAPALPVVEHPRKRKMRQARATQQAAEEAAAAAAAGGSPAPPADPPFMNNYKAFQEIRRQIDRRRRELFPITPKPPRGFKDYLINRATYVLAGNVHSRLSVPTMAPPCSLAPGMKELFVEQEIERYKLRLQHIIEKEKLVLTVEQEILRVHGRAARALANQALPFSACTILRDEEVYNLATPEQEEKDRNVRDRYNGRQFFSWLQDVDDKWEKIKEGMVLRHHNEAESLHAVQKMDWEWKLKEIGACDPRTTPNIDELHVPMVKVIDDFDMPPS